MATARRRGTWGHPGWWTLVLLGFVSAAIWLTAALYGGSFTPYVPVTLTSDRAGLVMEPGAKVKLRGVQVGRVASVRGGTGSNVSLQLDIFPDQAKNLPENVAAQISATTAFGAKYVDLIYPDNPSTKPLTAGSVLVSRNVSTEINTVFQNLVLLLKQIDPAKLNATLTALADGLRGQGDAIGRATTDANQVLLAVNPRMPQVQRDFRSAKGFADTYGVAASDILTVLNAASATSTTVTDHTAALDALLINLTGLAQDGIDLIAPNESNLIRSINLLDPTTQLLMRYNPEYTCLLQGAKWLVDNGRDFGGGNGYSAVVDAGTLLGKDPYQYPDNLPVVAAKGGPGGKPGCGSLPDATKNYPVRQLVTNTGWGTGTDIRTNPGIGHPCWNDWLPVTRAVLQPPSLRQCIPGPAIGPVPDPGAPPQGAPLYGPGGVPLWPGVPPAQPDARLVPPAAPEPPPGFAPADLPDGPP
jgi:phospholipid/cholesterol/gamma-HCH transport system substrate-binding protein